jgi:quercetin dioxygenase-like cupin family protein
MAESERTRTRERGPLLENIYERCLRGRKETAERQRVGPIVIKPADREVELSRQGRLLFYLEPMTYKNVPLQNWRVFTHEVRTKSGKHRHQGGLVIYVLEGKGYSIVEGERKDWKKGDLLLLPNTIGGVEHQHFNLDDKPSVWMAFINMPIQEHLAHDLDQTEESPEFKSNESGNQQ